ncbi:30S ribosomal protein S20 [Candidatus Falkowbacteria bacterium]|nr:30S ribosomal protein S20 [Candidatus Falkowbacteria bacterium]
MPNIKSAKKELKKSKKLSKKNLDVKLELKKLAKQSLKAIEAGDAKAEELVLKTLKAYDKATKKKVIKPNTRDRKKSRLHKKLNSSKKTKK